MTDKDYAGEFDGEDVDTEEDRLWAEQVQELSSDDEEEVEQNKLFHSGGEGSGNFEHKGRPGMVGGSSSTNWTTKNITQELIDTERESLRELEMGYDKATLKELDIKDVFISEEGEKTAQYSDSRKKGAVFPPIAVIKRGKKYEIVDGNRRYMTALEAGDLTIPAMVLEGFDLFKDKQPNVERLFHHGGQGSGNFDHSGRPGQVGGSDNEGSGSISLQNYPEGKVPPKVLNDIKSSWKDDRRDVAVGTIISRSKNDISIVKDGDEIVGVLGLRPSRSVFPPEGVPKGNYIYIDGIATKRGGYGEQVMQVAIDKAKASNSGILLTANNDVTGFYEKIGMTRLEKNSRTFYWTPKEVGRK
jgi:hypothetical protein